MHTLLLCVATAVVGIEAGWQRLPEGGMQYIIQIRAAGARRVAGGRADRELHSPRGGRNPLVSAHRGGEQNTSPRHAPGPPAVTKAAEPKRSDRPPPAAVPPQPLMPDPGSRSLPEHQTVYEQPPKTTAAAKPSPKPPAEPAAEKPAAPWLPLSLTLFGLIASLSAERVSRLDHLRCPSAAAGRSIRTSCRRRRRDAEAKPIRGTSYSVPFASRFVLSTECKNR